MLKKIIFWTIAGFVVGVIFSWAAIAIIGYGEDKDYNALIQESNRLKQSAKIADINYQRTIGDLNRSVAKLQEQNNNAAKLIRELQTGIEQSNRIINEIKQSGNESVDIVNRLIELNEQIVNVLENRGNEK